MDTGSTVAFFVLGMAFVAGGMFLSMRFAEQRGYAMRRRRVIAGTVLMLGTALAGDLILFASWSWQTVYELPALFLLQALGAVAYAAAFVWILEGVGSLFRRLIRRNLSP